jgi:hypothetical protein
MDIVGAEDMVFAHTVSPTMGSIDIGPHCVAFSGNGRLSLQDEAQLSTMADQVPDEKKTEYQAEIIVGPEWKVVNPGR